MPVLDHGSPWKARGLGAEASLSLLVTAALGLIALLLFMIFGSLKQTLVVPSQIPFALTGGPACASRSCCRPVRSRN
jgi:Cu/Ag efflux pump CusA